MEQNHFEVLLERIEHNTEILMEGFEVFGHRFERLEGRMDRVEERLDRVEVGQVAILTDVRDIKRAGGLLHAIANDHETRIQGLESTVKDHLTRHS